MRTYFAPPERKSGKSLRDDISFAAGSAFVKALLSAVPGAAAVLNEERQVLAVSDGFLSWAGLSGPAGLLGLRPGEAVECVHAQDNDDGCGTGPYCSTCGAAIAIVTSLSEDGPAERKCVLEVQSGRRRREIYLTVRASTVEWEGRRLVLLCLRDISREEKRASLERAFFHDMNNTIYALSALATSHDWEGGDEDGYFRRTLEAITARLKKDIEVQRAVSSDATGEVKPEFESVTVAEVLGDIEKIFHAQVSAEGANLVLSGDGSPIPFRTDRDLLVRILTNLVINALEAVDDGEVRVWTERSDSFIVFRVWNPGRMADRVAMRVFQKYFTTKEEPGRGFGTYTAKYFCEEVLGGHIDFTTSEEGTVFTVELPVYGC